MNVKNFVMAWKVLFIVHWQDIRFLYMCIQGLIPEIDVSSLHTHYDKTKYTNAKRSIPAHPTFVNDYHRDLHL